MPKHLPPDPSNGDLIDVGYFDDAYKGIEDYCNFGIEDIDLQGHTTTSGDRGWVKSKHIYKPDFYGSPSPRMEGVSALVYYRETDHALENRSIHHSAATGDDWVWVPGLTSTIKIPPPYERVVAGGTGEVNYKTADHAVTILASFYAFDMGGSGSEFGPNCADVFLTSGPGGQGTNKEYQNGAYEYQQAAQFALFINESRLESTDRYLFTGTRWNWMGARKQFAIMKSKNLPIGVHNIGVKVKMSSLQHSLNEFGENGSSRSLGRASDNVTPDFVAGSWKHVFVGGRNLIVQVDRR